MSLIDELSLDNQVDIECLFTFIGNRWKYLSMQNVDNGRQWFTVSQYSHILNTT